MNGFSGKTLAVFGDSIMYGSGNDGVGVGEFLAEALHCRLVKYCVGGARTGYQQGKSWIVEQVKSAIADGIRPDLVVFDGFTNDCYKTDGERFDVPLGERAAVKEIVEIEKEDNFSVCFESIVHTLVKNFPCAKIVFVRPHKMGRREEEAQRAYGQRAVEICRDYRVAVADIYSDGALDTFDSQMRDRYTNDSYGWGRGDATHPNEEGYRKFYIPLILQTLNGD